MTLLSLFGIRLQVPARWRGLELAVLRWASYSGLPRKPRRLVSSFKLGFEGHHGRFFEQTRPRLAAFAVPFKRRGQLKEAWTRRFRTSPKAQQEGRRWRSGAQEARLV